MSYKTENLAIVITDIVGYTEATQPQSRRDSARLLASHNHVLLPIIRRYQGRPVKNVGDRLLLVFRAPTDAMLCSMAMQDALFEYNRNAAPEQQIRIRIGASLGEVRVTRTDVFGEAVNITSRIGDIAPPDEIYLSEAVYMAMNKAEVPAQEVGWRELKGLSAPIRVFNIPRFATPRLVPQDAMAAEDMSDLVYPYGGAHLADTGGESAWRGRIGLAAGGGLKVMLLAALVLLPATLLAMHFGRGLVATRGNTVTAPALAVAESASAPAPAVPAQYQPEFEVHEPRPSTTAAPARPRDPARVRAPVPRQSQERQYQEEFVISRRDTARPPDPGYTRLSEAKRAYRDDKLGKAEYKRIANRLEDAMERDIDQAKRDYKADRISREQLKQRIIEIKKRYE